MHKGQISIDLLFSIVAVLLISFTFLGLVNSTYLTHERINTKLQLDMENDKITNIITQTQMISDSTYNINLTLEKINYLDSNKNQVNEYPTAIIENNTLKLSINTGKETIESAKTFSKDLETTIIIGTELEKGKIGIEHA